MKIPFWDVTSVYFQETTRRYIPGSVIFINYIQLQGFCEHGYEGSGFIKAERNFLASCNYREFFHGVRRLVRTLYVILHYTESLSKSSFSDLRQGYSLISQFVL
jgi:hypothetical protein